MAKMSVEIEGSAAEVVRVIRQLGNAGQRVTAGDAGESMETPAGEWTEALAADFLAGLDPAARRVARHIWQGGASGIRRSALCQRTELTPRELSLLMMRMGRALRGFQRERGVALSRPVAADRPLRSYFVHPDFAAAANSQMFDERMGQQLAGGAGRP